MDLININFDIIFIKSFVIGQSSISKNATSLPFDAHIFDIFPSLI